MKTNFPTRGISCFLVSVLLLVSCTKEDIGAYNQSESKIRISFSVPAIDKEATAPTGTPGATREALTANTTVRVVAFNSSNSTYSGDQAYFVNSSGNLRPCIVNADGTLQAVDPQGGLELFPDNYDFYAYTPAVALGENKNTVTVPNGVDYSSSVTSNISLVANTTVTLSMLNHKCSRIALVVKKAADYDQMTNLSVGAGGITINNLPASATNLGLNQPIEKASGNAMLTIPQTAFAAVGSSTTHSSAITYLLPRLNENRLSLNCNLHYTISGALGGTETKDISGSMGNIALDAGKSYTFTLTIRPTGSSLAVTEWIDGGTQDVVTGEEFDYSIDGSAGFLLSSSDMKNPVDGSNHMNWYVANGIVDATHNPTGLKACPDGWRVPTQEELMLLWIYNSAIPAKFSFVTENSETYWSSTKYTRFNESSLFISFLNGQVDVRLQSSTCRVRCVRSLTSPENSAPKATVDGADRLILDSRNVRSEGITSTKKATTTTWTESTPVTSGLGDIASKESNEQVHHYFEVFRHDASVGGYTWLSAVKQCSDKGSGWRLPTQRELMLMWIFRAAMGSKPYVAYSDKEHWSATNYGGEQANWSWYVNFCQQSNIDIDGQTRGIANSTFDQLKVRCVRDLDLPTL